MTKTQQSPTTSQPNRYRGPAWALAAFVAVLAVAAVFFTFAGGQDEVAETTPTPTTVAPDAETMTDLEVIEAGVAALYSGDAERAVELFELPVPNDDNWIREWAAYEAAIGGRLTLGCTEQDTPGVFACTVPYNNVFTDVIGRVESPGEGDRVRVVVDDGAITEFYFPVHTYIWRGIGYYLNEQSELDPNCFSLRQPECIDFMLDHLDEWATWAETNLEVPDAADG